MVREQQCLVDYLVTSDGCSERFFEFGRFTMAHDGFGGFAPYRACVTERYKLCINLLDIDSKTNKVEQMVYTKLTIEIQSVDDLVNIIEKLSQRMKDPKDSRLADNFESLQDSVRLQCGIVSRLIGRISS